MLSVKAREAADTITSLWYDPTENLTFNRILKANLNWSQTWAKLCQLFGSYPLK